MKKYLILIISMFLFIPIVNASSVNKINMDIYIDSNGDANVREVWDTTATSGSTELYKTYNNVGNSKFLDFKVSLNGKEYNSLNYWDIDASFSEKSYKNGIHYISDGLELCWGVSEYGNNTYTLEYKITNFVLELSDAQMVYWRLIPNNISGGVDNVYIKIYSDFKYSDTLDVWGYGKYGAPTYVYDGYIEMTTDDKSLDSNEYMTILIKYPLGSFITNNKDLSKDFNYYFNMAQKGNKKYIAKAKLDDIGPIISVIASIIPILLFGFWMCVTIYKLSLGKRKYFKSNKKLEKDIPNFRDIPCNGDIFNSFYISHLYGLTKKDTDFFGSVLLKWLKNGNIKITNEEKKGLFGSDKVITIEFFELNAENEKEMDLWNMMITASKDNVLEEKEFENYCKSHYSKVLNWYDKVLNYEMKDFISSGRILESYKKKLFGLKSYKYSEDDSIYEDAKKLAGLKQYLVEFSNMKEKQAIEVHLWQDYLIYAQMFGIAKKVAEQFKNMYPEVIKDYSNDFDISDVILLNHFYDSGITSATTAQARANSYSSGGGGFSSGGGGGGSFGGGGSGGGGFR